MRVKTITDILLETAMVHCFGSSECSATFFQLEKSHEGYSLSWMGFLLSDEAEFKRAESRGSLDSKFVFKSPEKALVTAVKTFRKMVDQNSPNESFFLLTSPKNIVSFHSYLDGLAETLGMDKMNIDGRYVAECLRVLVEDSSLRKED